MGGQRRAEVEKCFLDRLVFVECVFDIADGTAAFALDQCGEKVFLVLEIDVDRAFRDAGLAGDVVHAGGVEAHAHEDALGPVDDLLAFGRILARCPAAGQAALVVRCGGFPAKLAAYRR